MYTLTSDDHLPTACTVIICTRNRPFSLRHCLDQLQNQTFRSFEVLVVDNCLAPSEACGIAASFGARYILCPMIGLSHARNAGIAASHTELIAFLDDDAIPEADWLLNLLAEFSCQEVAAATGQVIVEDDEGDIPLYSQNRIRIDKTTPLWFEIANFGGIGAGTNMAFRRSALNSWPGFKEYLGRGQLLDECEDNYAFFTLVHRGLSIVYTPSAMVRHPERADKHNLRSKLHPVVMSTAYMTLLAWEHSIYIPEICRFLFDAARRTPRPWRSRSRKAFDDLAPTWLVYSVLLVGPFIYFYKRFLDFFRRGNEIVVHSYESKVPN